MSATRAASALRASLRAACNHRIQSQAPITLSRRGYASVQGAAHQAAHKAGSDTPWLATSVAITIPALAYLLYSGPEKKSHGEHKSEAGDRGVGHAKSQGEAGKENEPTPTSNTDSGDAESAGQEDKQEGAQSEDKVAADEGKKESPEGDKKQPDEKAADQKETDANSDKGKTDSSGNDSTKKDGEMDDSTESQEKKLSDKPSSKKVDPTEK